MPEAGVRQVQEAERRSGYIVISDNDRDLQYSDFRKAACVNQKVTLLTVVGITVYFLSR